MINNTSRMAHYKGAASEAGRAMQLMKKREKEMQDLELRKKRIEEDLRLNNIENKFATHYDAVEQQLKVTILQFAKRKTFVFTFKICFRAPQLDSLLSTK